MKKKKYVMHIVLAFVLGIVIASTLTVKVCDKMFCDDNFLARPSLRILDSICILRELRSKKLDEAIYLAEWQLDQDILELSLHVSPDNKDQLQDIVKHSIKQAQRYRAKHPALVKSPELLAAVNSVLLLDYSEQKIVANKLPVHNKHKVVVD